MNGTANNPGGGGGEESYLLTPTQPNSTPNPGAGNGLCFMRNSCAHNFLITKATEGITIRNKFLFSLFHPCFFSSLISQNVHYQISRRQMHPVGGWGGGKGGGRKVPSIRREGKEAVKGALALSMWISKDLHVDRKCYFPLSP